MTISQIMVGIRCFSGSTLTIISAIVVQQFNIDITRLNHFYIYISLHIYENIFCGIGIANLVL